MKTLPTVYIETSIVSYLTARPSRDVVVLGHQEVTREWWNSSRVFFDLRASNLVIQEASAGDAGAAAQRMGLLSTFKLLDVNENALILSEALLKQGSLPAKASADALHIAIAAVHNIQYLLTWNCKHIANAQMRPLIERICRNSGFEPPILCTPEELLGDEYVD
jgi:predicted nucleic acid-binding protein